MKYIYSFFILVSILLTSCNGSDEARALFERAEAVMEDYPDSALAILNETKAESCDFPRSQKMRYELLVAKAMNKAYVDFTTDSVMKEVAKYYDAHGTANEQVEAHYLLGCAYRDMNEAPMALNCYQDALDRADTLSEDCDFLKLMRVYGQMAKLFKAQMMKREEIHAYEMYGKCAEKAHDTDEMLYAQSLLLAPYYVFNDTSTVLKLYSKVRKAYLANGDKQNAARVCYIPIYTHLALGNYDEAKRLMSIFEHESGLFDNRGNVAKNYESYYHCKGRYYLCTNNFDSAKMYLQKAVDKGCLLSPYRDLMDYYNKKENYDSARHYLSLYAIELNNKLLKLETEAMSQAKSLYDYSRNQKIAEMKANEAERNREIVYCVITVSLLLVLGLVGLYYKRVLTKKQEIARMSMEFSHLYTLYSKANSDLVSIEQGYSSMREKKEAEIKELESQLECYRNKYSTNYKKQQIEIIQQSELLLPFREVLDPKSGRKEVKDSEWEELILLFKQMFPVIYERISYTNVLSFQEMQVAILTIIEFNPSQIAIILDKPIQRIVNIRSIANNKLFSEKTARTFENNLRNL